MNPKWKKELLLTWLLMLIASVVVITRPVSAQEAVLAAPIIRDLTKTPGSTFSIDITVANVEKLWGYDIFVYYNTTVLTATSYESYSPFTQLSAARINDTGGWVYMSYNMPYGEKEGFSTVEPKPIAKMTFRVDESGWSKLNLQSTVLASVEGTAITKEEVDGFFANIELPNHDIAITAITVSPTAVAINGSVTITVTLENQGDFSETFNVSAYYDSKRIGSNQTGTLSAGDSTTLTFTWLANVAKGTYTIKAVASLVPDEVDTGDNTRTATDKVTVGTEGGGGIPRFILYLGAGIAIVIVIAIVFYALRMRKPKTT